MGQNTTDKGISIDPTPIFELSPNLYSQFIEPLGTTDGSVEACWDHQNDQWREDFVALTEKLRPGLIRWGGCLSSYYRWKEAIGPRASRIPMYNILWHGMETNQVGTHEFVDLCRRVKATPFYCVNFESDGRRKWAEIPKWGVRSAGPEEAAEWVDYCNNPDNKLRKANGIEAPFHLKLWQLGNETSYDPEGFNCETAGRKTVEFAKAMRKADPDLELIAWGDSDWAPRMIEIAGEHVDYIAFHNSYRSTMEDQPFADDRYRLDPDATWEHLMTGADFGLRKMLRMREQVEDSGLKLALTEGHFNSVPGLGRGRVFCSWAAGVAYARLLNMYQRHGDILKIGIICDYAGTRWMCNGVIVPEWYNKAFLLPVTHVMSLFSHHAGKEAVRVAASPGSLDITASRSGKNLYLHVANIHRTRGTRTKIDIPGLTIDSGRVFSISKSAEHEVFNRDSSDALEPVEAALPENCEWEFPGASVTAIELTLR